MSKASRHTSFLRPSACAHRVTPSAASQPTRLPALLALACKRDAPLSQPHYATNAGTTHTHTAPRTAPPAAAATPHARRPIYSFHNHTRHPLHVHLPPPREAPVRWRPPARPPPPVPLRLAQSQQTAPVTALGAAGGAVGVL